MKKTFFEKLMLAFLFVTSISFVQAQQTPEKFILETKYLLYLPDGYASDTSTKWPLMIFLHGSGESGDSLDMVKAWGPPKLIGEGKKFPFIVVSPQAPPRTGWQVDILKKMLDDLKNKYRVDNERVYLTGLSMGGFGTWNFSSKYPSEFAAIAPICGGGNTDDAYKLRHMPIWCFHGAKDDVVPPASSQKMVDAVKKYNSDVRFTLYPEANHNSWEVTYNNDSLYTWLLSKKKFRYKPVSVSQKILKEYVGTFSNKNGDIISIELENEKLVAKPNDAKIGLNASSETNFYWDENSLEEIRFNRDKNKKVIGFTFIGGEIVEFSKR